MEKLTKTGFRYTLHNARKYPLLADGRVLLPVGELQNISSREEYLSLLLGAYTSFCPEAEEIIQALYQENLQDSINRTKPVVLNGEQLAEIRVHIENVRLNKKSRLEELNQKHRIKILFGPAADSWARVTGVEQEEKKELYLDRLDNELGKYPPYFLEKILKRIIIGDQVFSGPNPVAGLARERDMYLSITAGDFKGTLHHEVAHFVDEYLGGSDHDNVKYELAQFGKLQARNFGQGAKNFIRQSKKGKTSFNRPKNHPSAYGATEINESQAEIAKRLFTDYKNLMKQCKKEPPLLRAVNFMKAEYYAATDGRLDEKFWKDNSTKPNQNWDSYWRNRTEFVESEEGLKRMISYFGAEALLAFLEEATPSEIEGHGRETYLKILDSNPSAPDTINDLVKALDYYQPATRQELFLGLLEEVADDLLVSSKLGPLREPMRQLILEGNEQDKTTAAKVLENTLEKFKEQCALRYCKKAAFKYQEWVRQLADPTYSVI